MANCVLALCTVDGTTGLETVKLGKILNLGALIGSWVIYMERKKEEEEEKECV